MTYPAHWYYSGMQKATNNIDLEGYLDFEDEGYFNVLNKYETPVENVQEYFHKGDELLLFNSDGSIYTNIGNGTVLNPIGTVPSRIWVVDFLDSDNDGIMDQVLFMDSTGAIFNTCAQGEGGASNALYYKFKIMLHN